MWGRAMGFVLLISAVVLLGPAAAQATVTIGSDLGRAPTVANSCGPSCTVATTSLPSADLATGGLVSPVNGTVVMWRIRVGATTSQTSFRVITHPSTSGLATGGGSLPAVTPPVNATTAYPTQLPIGVGDLVGVDCCSSSGSQILANTPMAVSGLWNPRLVDGAPERPPLSMLAYEIPINAEIEPTSTFAISQVKPGKGGKLTVTATLPNPGTLAGGDKRDPTLAAAAGKKPRLYLKPATATAAVANQTIRLLMKPTKRARSLLAQKGRIKAKAMVVFTPPGGSSSAQILKVKLKR